MRFPGSHKPTIRYNGTKGALQANLHRARKLFLYSNPTLHVNETRRFSFQQVPNPGIWRLSVRLVCPFGEPPVSQVHPRLLTVRDVRASLPG